MYAQVEKPKEKKSRAVASSVGQKKSGVKQGFEFADNRPEAVGQRKLQEMANQFPISNPRTLQFGRRTVSAHGSLVDKKSGGGIKKIKIPSRKSVIRTAPPGATLGNISYLLMQNSTWGKDWKTKMRKKMKINTTLELYKNSKLLAWIMGESKIKKTQKQTKVLQALIGGKGYNRLLRGDKISLAYLEKNKTFENTLRDKVINETFQEYVGNTNIEEMELTELEPKLKSNGKGKVSPQNEFVSSPETLSSLLKKNPNQVDVILINACSYHANSEYTGIQIDG